MIAIIFIIVLLIGIGILTYLIEDKESILIIHFWWLCIVVIFASLIIDRKIDKIEQGEYKIDSVGYKYDSQTKDTIILYKLNKR